MFTRSAAYYDAIYAWKNYEDETRQLHALIQDRVPGASTLLDVACGTGMHLQHLQANYEVEGLDLDPTLLAVARERLPNIPFHLGDMIDFDLGKTFEVVVCLFSSIGYVETVPALHRAASTMARHLGTPGVLFVSPWFSPETWIAGHTHALYVDEPDLKVARMSISATRGRLSTLDLHYLVADPEGISYFTEEHSLGLFTHEEYMDALSAPGLEVHHDPEGLEGRGLYIAVRR